MAAPVRQGDILAGKYRVERILGEGGMGVVVAARHLQLDERVALKFLLPEALGDTEAIARFQREARAAVKIKSEHIARVSDVGTLANGAPYIVMEYLEGGDLGAWLEQRGPLDVAQAVEVVVQACEAIGEAHALGIVHRDLKPSNLFWTRRIDGTLAIKVLDFGISKIGALGESVDEMGMTRTKVAMGSPFYMSPEQMRSARSVDLRTDIWALGVTLYELLTGQVPFGGDSYPDVVLKVVSDQPIPPRAIRPELPEGLEAVILRCFEKDPARRFQNVAELVIPLAPFAPPRARASIERIARVTDMAGLARTGMSLALPGLASPALGPTPASRERSGGDRARGNKKIVGLALLATFAIAALAVFLWLAFKGGESEGATASPTFTATSTSASTTVPVAASTASPAATVAADDGAGGGAPEATKKTTEHRSGTVAPVRSTATATKRTAAPMTPTTNPFDDRK